jgi:hypothetical protein
MQLNYLMVKKYTSRICIFAEQVKSKIYSQKLAEASEDIL